MAFSFQRSLQSIEIMREKGGGGGGRERVIIVLMRGKIHVPDEKAIRLFYFIFIKREWSRESVYIYRGGQRIFFLSVFA